MKLAYVILQVALVGAGILVYDQMRGPDTTVVDDEAPHFRPRGESPTPSVSGSETVILQGAGVEGLAERVEAVEDRQSTFERALAQQVSALRDSGSRPLPSPGRDEPLESGRPSSVSASNSKTGYGEREVQWFRGLKKEVEQIERHERNVKMINRQIDRLGLSLGEDSRRQVVDATLAFRDRIRQTIQKSASAGGDREARRANLESLRQEYEKTVYNLVPSADAEKIAESMGRYPGSGFRQRRDR